MGTWSVKPFGNDTASDWRWKLEKTRDAAPLQAALDAITAGRRTKSVEACERAVAAAAIIDALRGSAGRRLPRETRDWAADRAISPSSSLARQAIRAVEIVLKQSALQELWDESRSAARWKTEMRRLLASLDSAATAPAPKPKPRAADARLSLPRLIARVKPNQDNAARAALRRKIDALADVNAIVPGTWERTPLHLVAARGLIPEAVRLLARGAEINPVSHRDATVETPLEAACGNGHAEMVEFLIARGAKAHRETFIDESRGFAMPVRFETPDTRPYRYPATLYRAVDSGSIPTIEALHRRGVDLGHAFYFNGETALHRAADADDPAMIRFLVTHRLKLEARNHLRYTPLLWAVANARRKAAAALLELGADPNAKDDEGATALDHALANKRRKDLARLIRKFGGRPGAKA